MRNLVEPWGKKSTQRKDIEQARKTQAEGGSGVALAFWTWSEEQVVPYV
jgi:retinol dehydrogenase-12